MAANRLKDDLSGFGHYTSRDDFAVLCLDGENIWVGVIPIISQPITFGNFLKLETTQSAFKCRSDYN